MNNQIANENDNNLEIKESSKHACYGPGEDEDVEAASSLCKVLGIDYHVYDLHIHKKSTSLIFFLVCAYHEGFFLSI